MSLAIKHSKGVIALAVLLALGSVVAMTNSAATKNYDAYFGILAGFFALLNWIFSIAGILIGMGLLSFCKNIFRKAVIILNVAFVISALFRFWIAWMGIAANFPDDMSERRSAFAFAVFISIIFNALYIYVFTLPSIKEEFKE